MIPERCVPIAKRELLYLGTVGWACWLSGIIFIDRLRSDAAIEVMARTASALRRDNVSTAGLGSGKNPGQTRPSSALTSVPVPCSSECGFSPRAPGTRANPCCPSSVALSTWLCRPR